MSTRLPDTPRRNVSRALFLVVGSFFFACALLYNPWVISLAVRFTRGVLNRPWTTMPEAGPVVRAELVYIGLGAVFAGIALLIGATRWLDRFFRHALVEKLTLAVLVLAIPVATLEVALRPYVPGLGKGTSLFVKDRVLGWRLRPSTTQPWGGMRVTTNAKGLRGPEIPYEKPAGCVRILYLGDSVTFGYKIERWEDTFPAEAEAMIEGSEGVDVETINAGVGGYSPWQELAFLRHEGFRYAPDVVVVGFVLNDVTEKFTLVRYGGREESRQVRESYYSRLDMILSRSALATKVRKFARDWKARRVLGSDTRLGAIERETFDVETLIEHPEQAHIQAAWEITLESLQGIFDACRARDIPALLVVHPFSVQLAEPDRLSAPQRRLTAWARDQGVRCVDLLPILSDRIDATGETPETLYLDHDHLSARGHRVVAAVLADTLRAMIDERRRAHR